MARPGKPYQRSTSDTYRRGNPDDPGGWKHDLHESPKTSSLASRLASSTSSASSSSRSSLLNRISGGQGTELLPSGSSPKLYGFGDQPPPNINNTNAGLELLPSGSGNGARPRKSTAERGRLVENGLNAALGRTAGTARRAVSRPVVVQDRAAESVSIMGAARGSTWVRVEHLAAGTTAEDVVSAFAPIPIMNAKITSTSSASTVTVELEFPSRSNADEVIGRYHGAVADGNTLSVTIVRQNLAERMTPTSASSSSSLAARMGSGGVGPVRNDGGGARVASAGKELLPSGSGSKMYSDSILASNPSTAIITLAEEEAVRARRADAWMTGGPSLAQRVGNGRGRGQIGGGSYADMMVD